MRRDDLAPETPTTRFQVVDVDSGQPVEDAPVASTLTEAELWIAQHGDHETMRVEPIARAT